MQDDLRNKIIKLKELEGVSYTYICKNIDISNTTISLFIKGERSLSKVVEDRLLKFLDRYDKY